MKCLRTGCYLKVDQNIYHCDLYANEDSEVLVFKGFARDCSPFKEIFDVEILENGELHYSEQFISFMEEWNDKYLKCLEWGYKIEDVKQKLTDTKFIYSF